MNRSKSDAEIALPESDLARQVIAWQARAGRHGLPWQKTRDPYRVWLSEVMLQQTQVSTVLDYYPRFLGRFPDIHHLAEAPLEEVLGMWSGLGYYSRARNLHRCADVLVSDHHGMFPRTASALSALPGIGRSTAAAIAAFCFGERAAILDGNVKRVLTRFWGVADDLSVAANERVLWTRAEAALPHYDLATTMPAYTQGLMDLGATVCTRSRPVCAACPLELSCVARQEGAPQRYPVKTKKIRRSQQTMWLLHAQDDKGRVWLVQRPAHGIWAGLHCLPVFDSRDELLDAMPASARALLTEHDPVKHVLTHRDLDLHYVTVIGSAALPWPGGTGTWYEDSAWTGLGLPAPIRKFMSTPDSLSAPLFTNCPTPGVGAS